MATYNWLTGQIGSPVAAPIPGYGPRTPNLVGVGATVARKPAFPTYTAGPFGQRVPYDPSLYKKKPPVKKALPGPKAPVDPYQKWIDMMQSYIETPAQQEARVRREIDAQIAAQKKVMDDDYERQKRDAMAAAQAMSLAGQAAAGLNKDLFSLVGGEFNAAAGEMKGLAHSLSGSAAGATAGDVAKANAALGALGNAPVAQGGTFGVGGETQRGVEEYRGGTLPGQMFTTQGEAANFGLAGMIGSEMGRMTAEGQAGLMKAMSEIRDNRQKAMDSLTAGRLDLYHQYMSDAKDSQIKYISLVQGLISAKQTATAGTKPVTQKIGNTLYQYDSTTGKWVKVAQGAGTTTKPTTKTVGGSLYQYDPATNTWKLTVEKPTDITVPHTKVMGNRTYQWNPNTATWVDIGPAAAGKPTQKKPPITGNQLNNLVTSWYQGKSGPTKIVATDKDGNEIRNKDGSLKYITVPKTTGQLGYQQAYRRLRAMKVSDTQARQALNTAYRRGERGRPYLSAPERAVLKLAKVNTWATRLTQRQLQTLARQYPEFTKEETHASNAVLTPAQVAALQAVGMLPDGWWISGTYGGGTDLGRRYLLKEGY